MRIMKKRGEILRHNFGTVVDGSSTRSNLHNDKILRELIHTKILSGSLRDDLELSPAEKKKALAGRVLELSAAAKLGKGEASVRKEERNKAAKRVRLGLERKLKERNEKALEEVSPRSLLYNTCRLCFLVGKESRELSP